MTQWYYADTSRQRQGPVEMPDIRALYQRGDINDQTLVWREGMSQWQALQTVADELELQAVAPPVTGGIDLRADLQAIEAGTAPMPGTGGGTHSPYTASSSFGTAGNTAVQGHAIVHAGLWRRFAASLIDSLVTSLASYAVLIPLMLVFGISLASLAGAEAAGSLLFLVLQYGISIMIPAAYFGWMHSRSSQATLGKMAVGIKVCRTDGDTMSLGRSFGRYFAYLLFVVFTCGLGALISGLMVAFSQRKQALHDMICDTIVVDRWAFTDQPELQKQGLDTVTMVVLGLFALLVLGGIALAVVVAMIAAN